MADTSTNDTQTARCPQLNRVWYFYVAALIAVASLISTAQLVFDPAIQQQWASNADSLLIAQRGMEATWHDIGGWWTGSWIQHEMYYRPLSSMLFFAEAQLFGTHFQPYCIVSWLANAINVVLLFFLGASLARGSRRTKIFVGALTAVLFLIARHPQLSQGPGNPEAAAARVTWGMMPWWPAQTDIFSMLFGVLSLVLLDRWLITNRRSLLTGAIISFVAALLFKEMALCIPLMVPLMVLYRRRERFVPVVATAFGIGILFFAIRSLAAPGASGLEFEGAKTFSHFFYYVAPRFSAFVATGYWFPILASLGLIALVLILAWRRIEGIWIGLTALLWLLGSAQLIGGNFALITIGNEWSKLIVMGVFWSGLLVLALVRNRGVSLALFVAVLAACVPVINRIGPHYWYWPLAFWSLFSASIVNRLLEIRMDGFEALIVSAVPQNKTTPATGQEPPE